MSLDYPILPPTNEYGTFVRPLTRDEWLAIKRYHEARMKEAANLKPGENFWDRAAWSVLGSMAQIRECEKHL